MKEQELLEKAMCLYDEKLRKGTCAHAALALITQYAMMQCKEEGYTFDETVFFIQTVEQAIYQRQVNA